MAPAVGNARSGLAAGVDAQQQGAVAVTRGGKRWAWLLGVVCWALAKPSFAQAIEPQVWIFAEPEEAIEGLTGANNSNNNEGADQRNPEGQGKTHENTAPSPRVGPPWITNSQRDLCAFNSSPDRYEECKRQEKDLEAQENMAWAALLMTWVAVFSLILSAVGVWLVCKTLRYTRGALIEAKRATRAANATVRVTREMSQQQMRAYLAISCEVTQTPDSTLKPFVAVVTIKNTGQTPAYKLKATSSVVVRVAKMKMILINGSCHRGALSPGQQAELTAAQWSPENYFDWTASITGPTVIVVGEVNYTDAFGEKRTSSFRLRHCVGEKYMREEPDGNEST